MTNTTINYINIDGIKIDINKNITSYNTDEEFEGYKITTIEYKDYLIIFSKDKHVTTISINSIDYPYYIFNSSKYVLACKTDKNYKLYENKISIRGLKIFGGEDETVVKNFRRKSSLRYCMYLQSTPKYTYYNIDLAPSIVIQYKTATDSIVALIALAIFIKQYSHAIFYKKDNYLYGKFLTNINDWDIKTNTENQGTLPIIVGYNTGELKGFFSGNNKNYKYWHNVFDSSNFLKDIGANCVNIDVEQILSNNPNQKPTLILNYNGKDEEFEFTNYPNDPVIKYVDTCDPKTYNGYDWPAIAPGKYTYFYKDCDDEGYYKTIRSYCNFGGNLTKPEISSCKIKKCPAESGYNETDIGKTILKECPSGFTGNITRKCINNVDQPFGKWEDEVNNCKAITHCPENGSWPQTIIESTATENCDSGFTGNKTRKCNSDGTWEDEDTSACVEETNYLWIWIIVVVLFICIFVFMKINTIIGIIFIILCVIAIVFAITLN